MTRRASLVAVSVAQALLASTVLAAVPFTDWRASSFDSVVDEAARAKKPVVLVVTQPDWCPPCIKLDEHWLKNENETQVRDLLKDAVVLEVRGYEADGAALLRDEGVQFQGTPTVHVYAPEREATKLGGAPLLGSIVGAPEDFPAKLEAILAKTSDPIPGLEAAAEGATDAVVRAKAYMDLGAALAARGDGDGAYAAYERVLPSWRGWIPIANDAQAAELAELRRKAAWEQVSVVLRVQKNDKRALRLIDSWAATYVVRPEERERFGYARAWALERLGRRDEAVAELDASLPATADGADTFLYFCFRSDDRHLWILGERRGWAALQKYPNDQAVLWQDLGRLQRRLGALALAESSFDKAVKLSKPGEDREVYESQLATVRAEMGAKAVGL